MNHPTAPLCNATGGTLSLTELLTWLRRRLRLRPLGAEALADKLLLAGARAAGLSIPDAELQQAANRWRRQQGLDGAAPTHAWLAANGLTPLDLQANLEAELLLARFKQQLAGAGLEERFGAQQARFARALLTRVVAADEALARELLAQVREGGNLLELAAQHQLPVQGPAPAYRFQLPPQQAEAIFGAAAGAVVGPFPGQGFSLVRIDELFPPQLDPVAAKVLGREAVDAWLSARMADLKFA